MNSIILVLSCLTAVALGNPGGEVLEYMRNGQRTCRVNCRHADPFVACPPTNCPPPSRNPQCLPPDCNYPPNRNFHHPHQDPNFYWTCQLYDELRNIYFAVEMPCACGTLFWSPANRCVHPFEWSPEVFCPGFQPINPPLRPCDAPDACPDCNTPPTGEGEVTPTPPTPTPQTPTPTQWPPVTAPPPSPSPPPPTPSPPPNGCPCICVPCVWWPCMPCNGGGNNCPCPQQPQQPQQPQLPPQSPWNPPNQPQPWNPPNQQNPWELPNNQNPWERPVQPNPWDRPAQPNPWEIPQW